MHHRLSLFLAVTALAAGSALADIVDSRLYLPSPGDEVIDSGVMNVSRLGQAISSEEFRVIRRADGGRTIVSMVTAADDSFEIPARWDYDADEQATGATGWGKPADGRAVEVGDDPVAGMGGVDREGDAARDQLVGAGVAERAAVLDRAALGDLHRRDVGPRRERREHGEGQDEGEKAVRRLHGDWCPSMG